MSFNTQDPEEAEGVEGWAMGREESGLLSEGAMEPRCHRTGNGGL